MKRFCSIFAVLVLAASRCAWGADALRLTPVPRQPGGRLHLSLQNEADAAIGRAARWLLATQHRDGYWGASNRMATAYAVLALQQTPSDAHDEAAARGREWLLKTVEGVGATNTFWTALATGLDLPKHPATDSLCPLHPLAVEPARFSPLSGDRLLLIAKINRAIPAGLLVTPADWREMLAARLIAGQRHDPQNPGGGFWPAHGEGLEADAAAQTALAALILLQL